MSFRNQIFLTALGFGCIGILLGIIGMSLYGKVSATLPIGFNLAIWGMFLSAISMVFIFGYIYGRDVQAQRGGHRTYPNPKATL